MDLPSHEREESLSLLWEDRADPGCMLCGAAGERIVVVSRGVRNRSAGPDYLDAVLVVDGHLVTGDVEVHLRERDWFLHGHDRDPAFERVKLHLVGELRPPRLLAITTLAASELDRASTAPPLHSDGDPGPVATPTLIAELSWGRFLRRVLVTLREDHDLTADLRIERAFLRRLYDALGYMENREPMRRLADRMLARRDEWRNAALDDLARLLFACAGMTIERFVRIVPEERGDDVRRMLAGAAPFDGSLPWHFEGRTGNDPARRLWGALLLTHGLIAHGGLDELITYGASPASMADLVRRFMVRMGSTVLVGRDRGAEITVNVLFPMMLVAGILRGEVAIIERACERYRTAPSLGSNRIIRLIESRYLRNERLNGAFWQQGAIEFQQRYLTPDRSAISFIADRERKLASGVRPDALDG